MSVLARGVLPALIAVGLGGCGPKPEAPLDGRWYTQSQVDRGRVVFLENCAVCHGERAAGTQDWKRRLADGSLPPPPLDGSAHAWHHDLDTLERTIINGGVALGGTMPGFGDRIDRQDRLAAIAYFQSFWPEQTMAAWRDRFR